MIAKDTEVGNIADASKKQNGQVNTDARMSRKVHDALKWQELLRDNQGWRYRK